MLERENDSSQTCPIPGVSGRVYAAAREVLQALGGLFPNTDQRLSQLPTSPAWVLSIVPRYCWYTWNHTLDMATPRSALLNAMPLPHYGQSLERLPKVREQACVYTGPHLNATFPPIFSTIILLMSVWIWRSCGSDIKQERYISSARLLICFQTHVAAIVRQYMLEQCRPAILMWAALHLASATAALLENRSNTILYHMSKKANNINANKMFILEMEPSIFVN